MLSLRTRAHVGLFAAAFVLLSSMTVLLRSHQAPHGQAVLPQTDLQAQVVITDTPTLLSQR